MKELNFQKIIDTIAEAFNIFDFSFIVSGGASYLIIFTLLCYKHLPIIPSTGCEITFFIICSILVVYVLGLISWSIGKFLRKKWIVFEKDRDDTLKNIYNSYKGKDEPSIKISSEYFDTYAWTKLISLSDGKSDGINNRLSFLNRMWVMQAVCEGLMGSCCFAIIALGYLIYEDWPITNGTYETVVIEGLLIIIIIFIAFLLSFSAKSFARTKIKDIYVAYQIFVDKNEQVDILFKEDTNSRDIDDPCCLKKLKTYLCKKLCGCNKDR